MAARSLFEPENDAHLFCSGFCKHGRILLKFGMQISIEYGIIENGKWGFLAE
jgi:hypothetical protein